LHNGSKGIPNWFEHRSKGPTISFWFRKKIPSVTSIILFPNRSWALLQVNYFVNGYDCTLSNEIGLNKSFSTGYPEHTHLFDLKLEEQIKWSNFVSDDMDNALLQNEWIHVELKLTMEDNDISDNINILRTAQMGIHVLKEKSNTEENVIFTSPYAQYNNTSLSQFHMNLVSEMDKSRADETNLGSYPRTKFSEQMSMHEG